MSPEGYSPKLALYDSLAYGSISLEKTHCDGNLYFEKTCSTANLNPPMPQNKSINFIGSFFLAFIYAFL
jgi:hypothetical protein